MDLFFVERWTGRSWHIEVYGVASRSEALQAIEGLRSIYGKKALFRMFIR
jgi:hypothetical protein